MRSIQLEIINGVLFAITILGINALDYFTVKISSTDKILVSIILLGIYLWAVKNKGYEKFHSLPENSKRKMDFFKNWYKKDGKLYVFCNDLEWLDSKHKYSSEVVDVLRKKKENLFLYLRNKGEDEVARDLINNGARHFDVKESIHSRHSLSVVDNEGIMSIIIRNKDIISNDIVFIESDNYRDPYLISIAMDMMENCYGDK